MKKIQIKHRFSEKVIFEGEFPSIKDAVEEAVRQKVNLSNADLYNADLYNANLFNANLSNADLSNADLSNSNLSYANLSNANLFNAKLSSANLSNADLSNAKYNNTYFTLLNLPNQRYSIGVIKNKDSEDEIKIGCERHKVSEWEGFTNKKWRKIHKNIILSFVQSYPK